MKIRIGNDISLNVTLLYKEYGDDAVNINSVKAFIINSSKEDEARKQFESKTKFISRFPVEPYIDAYSSTAYDVKSCGYPTWRAYPKNYVYATYSGFGPNPNWDQIYRHMPECNLTQYQAEVKYTDDRSKVNVYFPAEAQLYTGTYTLVIVAKIYEPGYSKDNLKTVTVDYEDVFTLVGTSEGGVDGPVTINVTSTTKGGPAESVTIYGSSIVGINGAGSLAAEVNPSSVYDKSVTWSIPEEDANYLYIVNRQPNYCTFVSTGLPDGVDTKVVTVYAQSNQTQTVIGRYSITIDRNYIGSATDIYVGSGQYVSNPSNGGNISLSLTSGQQVDVDLSKAVGWYEGN